MDMKTFCSLNNWHYVEFNDLYANEIGTIYLSRGEHAGIKCRPFFYSYPNTLKDLFLSLGVRFFWSRMVPVPDFLDQFLRRPVIFFLLQLPFIFVNSQQLIGILPGLPSFHGFNKLWSPIFELFLNNLDLPFWTFWNYLFCFLCPTLKFFECSPVR